jgi:hypothetical protein
LLRKRERASGRAGEREGAAREVSHGRARARERASKRERALVFSLSAKEREREQKKMRESVKKKSSISFSCFFLHHHEPLFAAPAVSAAAAVPAVPAPAPPSSETLKAEFEALVRAEFDAVRSAFLASTCARGSCRSPRRGSERRRRSRSTSSPRRRSRPRRGGWPSR